MRTNRNTNPRFTFRHAALGVLTLGALMLAGCEDVPSAGDSCEGTSLSRYECSGSDEILQCRSSGGERIWVRVSGCNSGTHCVTANEGRDATCAAN